MKVKKENNIFQVNGSLCKGEKPVKKGNIKQHVDRFFISNRLIPGKKPKHQ